MATLTRSIESVFIEKVRLMLNDYEEFHIQQPMGYADYQMTLKTNVMIHRSHTKKDVFFPHSIYQGTSITVIPNAQFMKYWVKNAREAAQKFLDKGEYTTTDEEGSTLKRKFNKWMYYDNKRRLLIGTVHSAGATAESPTSVEIK